MNRTYALVWNPSLATWSVANEHARRRGKGAGAVLAAALLLPLTAIAADLPTGGQVVAGQGQIGTPSANQMVIDQASNKLAIDWQSFDIGKGNKVTFNQPGTDSIALNRVLGADGSKIMGQLDANGRVFIVNPNGVLFGQDAQVNVGGLVASTLDISNSDFEAGNYRFKGDDSNASVINNGQITAVDGGAVALLGGTVSNNGVIVANQGSVALAAGNAVTLDFAGDGLLNVQVDEAVVDALVENHQLIKADGGQVLLTANAGEALLKTVVNNTGVIEAQTLGEKDGKIVLLGDFDGGTVQVAGTLDASAPKGGNGGFIETSGAHVKVADSAKVTTKAADGKTGTWLIDPTDFTVSAGNTAQTSSGIGASTLSSNLASNNITLETAPAANGTDKGDIHVNAAVTWSADTTLTLSAHNDININAAITASGANGKVALKYGRASTNGGTADYHIDMGKGGAINLQGGQNFSTQKGNSGTITYNVVNDAAALQAMDSNGFNYALGSDIDLSSIANWQPVGGSSGIFTGKLTGLGHSLSNLKINRANDAVGLFGITSSSEIRDLSLMNVDITGNSNVGALVGENGGNVSNVNVSGSVTGGNNVGGLIGYNWGGGNISNSHVSASVSGSDDIGGLVGQNLGSISNAYATATVTGAGHRIGGLVGINLGAVSGAYASGSVDGRNELGGLVGVNDDRIIQYPGGSSERKTGTISNSFATGNVGSLLENSQRGGLVGRNLGTITNAYSTGNAQGSEDVGGLAGRNLGTITDTYSTGKAEGTTAVGGLVGTNENGTISRSFYTTDNNDAGSANGAGKTRAELTQAATFAGWDISRTGGSSAVWRIYDGQTGPLLRSFLQSVTLTVDASGGGKTYNGTAATGSTGYTGSSLGNALDTSKLQGSDLVYTSDSKNAGTYRSTDGTLIFSGLYSSQHGYDISYSDTSLTIGKAALSVTGITASNKVYDATTSAATSIEGVVLDGLLVGDDVSLSVTGQFRDKHAGTGKTVVLLTTYSGDDLGNYTITHQNTTTASISKANLVVSGISAVDKTYNGSTDAMVSGNATVTAFTGDSVSVAGTAVATFDDKNAGTGKDVTVTGYTLDGTDASNYNIVQPSGLKANINKASITAVTGITAGNRIYDGSTNAVVDYGNAAFTGRVGNDDLTVTSASGAFTDKNAGIGKTVNITGITLGGDDAGNYTLANTAASTMADIAKASISAVTGITADNRTYDGTTTTSLSDEHAGFTGRFGNDDLTVASANGAFANKNAGIGKTVNITGITLGGEDAGNYVLTSTTASTTADIAKANISAVTGIIAKNRTYDGTTNAVVDYGNAALTGLIGNDDLTITSASGAFTNKNAGIGKTVNITGITLGGDDAGNYTLASTTTSTTADIAKASIEAVTGITAENRTYDGTTDAFLNTGSAGFTGLIGNDDLTVTSASGAFTNKNAGIGKTVNITGITLGGDDAGNYTLDSTTTSTTADITKADISVTGITAENRTYDGTTNAVVDYGNAALTGLIGNDDLTVTSASGAFTNKNAGIGKTVNITGITLGGNDAGNYTLASTTTSTTADIAKASIEAVTGITAENRTYDGTTDAVLNTGSAGFTGLIGNDELTVTSASGAFTNKNAGIGKTVNITGITLGGDDAGNYTLANTAASTMADIAKASISAVTGITADNRTYDGTTTTSLSDEHAGFTGRFGNDDLTVASANGAFANKNAGIGKTVNITGITLGGEDAGNYVLTSTTASTTADIAKANISAVTGIIAKNRTYDGTTNAVVDYGNAALTGLIGNDDLTITSASGAFTNKNAGIGKTVNITGITLGGDDAGNYTLASTTTSTMADIAKASISSVTGITAENRTYDGSTNAILNTGSAAFNGRFGNDDLTVASANGAFANKHAGDGKAVNITGITLGGDDAGNYILANTAASTMADIAKASISSVTGITAENRTYNGSTDATLNTGNAAFTGRFGDDDLTVTSASGAFTDKNASDGKTVNITGITLGGDDAGNYILADDSATTAADIARAALTITANNDRKTVGQTADLNDYGINGLFSGDSVSGVTLTSEGTKAEAVVGSYLIAASDVQGIGLDNYDITYVDGTLAVDNNIPYLAALAANGHTVSTEPKQQAQESEALTQDMLVTNPIDERLNLQVINQGIRLPEGI